MGLDDLLGFLPGLCSGGGSTSGGFFGAGGGSSATCLLNLLPLPAITAEAFAGGSGKNSPLRKADCVCTAVTDKTILQRCLFSCRCSDGGQPFVETSYSSIVKTCPRFLTGKGNSPNSCPKTATFDKISENPKTKLGGYILTACF